MPEIVSERMRIASRNNDIFLALAVVGMMMLLIMPLTPVMLDILIALSIVLGVITLLVTLYTEDSLAFSSFPSLLLILTLFRLGLNIASTRMILTQAQAGEIIKTFGEFVTGGSQLVGFLIFVLLTTINFIVITKGSGRVAEVAARFNLDALPGRQMAIDADVNAGVIDETQAQKRREKIIFESDFYGAMDGASKFVRGEAIAAVVIIFLTAVGSFIIGLGMRGLSWDEVVRIYMTLTIGDGLVTQIPALLISVGAGIIVTRSSSKQRLGDMFRQQMFNNPRVLGITATVLTLLSLVPGMPKIVMWPMAGVIYLYARALRKNQQISLPEIEVPADQALESDIIGQQKDMEKMLFIDPIKIELGEKLFTLTKETQRQDLLSRMSLIRREIASELGIVVPSIRIHDNLFLSPDNYIIKIKGNDVASANLYLDRLLAVNPGHITRKIEGIQTTDPVTQLAATWIMPDQRKNAEDLGYAVVDPLAALTAHLTEVIHLHAHELLNRQEVAHLIENVRTYASAVVDELIPNRLSTGDILKVLQNLLRERVSIRDIVTILETIADHSDTRDPDTLTEYVRIGLARTISKQYADQNKAIHAIIIDPKVEQMMNESIQKNDYGKRILMNPETTKSIIEEIRKFADPFIQKGIQPVLLTSPELRSYVKKFIERSLPHLPVLAFNEVIAEIKIVSIGSVSQEVLMQYSALDTQG